MKTNNVINNVFKTGFSMESFYALILWDLIESDEYTQTNLPYQKNVTDSTIEYIKNIGPDNIMSAIETSQDKTFSNITKQCAVDYTEILYVISAASLALDDFEKTYTDLMTFMTMTSDKIEIIETIMNSTDDQSMKKACKKIIDTYQHVMIGLSTAAEYTLLTEVSNQPSRICLKK